MRYVIAENSMIYANLMALSFIEPELRVIEVLHCRSRDLRLFSSCDLDLDPMTFNTNWRVFPGDTPDVQIWTSYAKVFES